MVKKILVIDGNGPKNMGQYTVVYENKTYWYCKRSGTDLLTAFEKQATIKNSTYVLVDENDEQEELTKKVNLAVANRDREIEKGKLKKEIETLKRKVEEDISYIRSSQNNVVWYGQAKERHEKTLADLQTNFDNFDEYYQKKLEEKNGLQD